MKTSIDREMKEYLKERSVCKKCIIQPFERLEPNIRDLLTQLGLGFQVECCRHCGNIVIHIY